jgi:hypothetical protein
VYWQIASCFQEKVSDSPFVENYHLTALLAEKVHGKWYPRLMPKAKTVAAVSRVTRKLHVVVLAYNLQYKLQRL